MSAVATLAAVGEGFDWRYRGACARWPGLHTSDATGSLGNTIAGRAQHVCLNHCPVLRECRELTRAVTPVAIVQAGVRFGTVSRRERGPAKRQGTPTGCGPWCVEMRKAGLSWQSST